MKKSAVSALLLLLCILSACNRDPNVAKQRYLENGNKYYEKGKYKEALIMYRNALKRDMKFGEAYYRSGLADLQLQRFAEAARDFQRAVELQPTNIDAHDRLTNLFLNVYLSDKRRPKQLLDELGTMADRYTKRFPNSYSEARLRGYLALFSGDGESALKLFAKANQIKPYQPDLVMVYMQTLASAKRTEEAQKLGYEMLAKDPSALAVYDVLYLQYATAQNTVEAEKILQLKVKNNPKNADAHLALAGYYYAMKNRDQMLAALKPLESDPTSFPNGALLAGDFFLRIQDYDLAAQKYQEGAQKVPKDKHAYQKRLVEVLVRQEKKDAANQLVNEILKEDPKDSEALAIRASLALLTGTREQLQSAINDLQTVVNRMPENFVLRYNLGRALLARQSVEAARVQFEEAIKLRPDYLQPRLTLAQMMLQNREYGKAVQMSQEILNYDPANLAAKLLRSRGLIGMGDLRRARDELTQTSQQFPQVAEAKLQIAALDLQDRNFKDAEASFRKLYSQSQDPRAFMGLIQSYVAQGQAPLALKMLREELAKADRPEYRAAVAGIAVSQQDYATAIAEYKKVIEKAPRNPQAWLELSEAHRLAGDLTSAVDAVKKAQEIAPTNAVAHLQMAMLYDTHGKKTEAKPAYEQVLRLEPDNPIALNNLAYMLADTGTDLDQALTMAQKARQSRPNDENVADTLGWVYIRKNLPDSAAAVYKDLVQKNPQRAMFRYHLAMALYQKGDKLQARRECEVALKSNPSPDESARIRELMSKLS